MTAVWTDDMIDACRFRMFALHEIAGAMTMAVHTTGGEYQVLGNKRERMAQYGNAVTPPVMQLLVGRLLDIVDDHTITDLFCGAGGSSLGAEQAGGRLRLALNHWQRAIETHATNFEHADHDCNDVSALTTSQIRRYPDSAILLASPECTNHSLAKGARRRKPQEGSLWEDGPAGDAEQDRSRATMWDVPRFAEHKLLKGKPYQAIVVENVVDAFKWGPNDNGALFDAWLETMGALGYRHRIVWLNSMFAPPTPQSRDRMYVVFWQKGMREPDLDVEPVAWCPHCEKIVNGLQTWKRPDRRPWGRYGAQYFYSCPDCHGVVLPGACPAASIIDDTLPAQVIGERARPLAVNTRERIRRGLERLAREPFAIRLTHGGAPRPLTLPLITLTQRHDPAVVIPVAGNTHERTPGNRAQDAELDPLRTVHGTLDRAIVHPRGIAEIQRHGDVRPIYEPVHTVRAGGQHHALVMANREHGVPRDAEREPAQTACTGHGCGLAIVRNNTARGDAGQMTTPGHEPIRALTTKGHQSVVIPYDRTGDGRDPALSPTSTLTTRDRMALIVPLHRGVDPADADRAPAATVTTRGKLALVVPPMGGVELRDASTQPAPTQTTTTRAGLVTAEDAP